MTSGRVSGRDGAPAGIDWGVGSVGTVETAPLRTRPVLSDRLAPSPARW
jgi:hypothetical protein